MLKAGLYYVGDPCYVLNEENGIDWADILDETDYFGMFKENTKKVYNDLADQHCEWSYKGIDGCTSTTAYGDGTYWDLEGRAYAVDAGMIGAVPLNALGTNTVEEIEKRTLGHIVEFDENFTIDYDEGRIIFKSQYGNELLAIETGDDAWDEYGDDYDEEDYA